MRATGQGIFEAIVGNTWYSLLAICKLIERIVFLYLLMSRILGLLSSGANQLDGEFEASLGYVTPNSKKSKPFKVGSSSMSEHLISHDMAVAWAFI